MLITASAGTGNKRNVKQVEHVTCPNTTGAFEKHYTSFFIVKASQKNTQEEKKQMYRLNIVHITRNEKQQL